MAEADERLDSAGPGDLDVAWLRNRCVGVARADGPFVDIGHSITLARLRTDLAPRIVHHGLDDLDAAAIRLSVPRRFTQEISRHVYDVSTWTRRHRFAGIAYRSRLGDEFRNWAIFEPGGSIRSIVEEAPPAAIERDDPDLRQALERLGVRLVDTPQ